MPEIDHPFPVRIQRSAGAVRAYSRAQAFDIGSQAGLRETDDAPSAVEYLLGALGGDLVCGFERAAEAEGMPLHGIEISLDGRLDNILTHLGVVGEEGHPGLRAVAGTVYIGADADQPTIDRVWRRTLARSPVYNTLIRCADVTLKLVVMA